MDQALITIIQVGKDNKNIHLMIPYGMPEDEILSLIDEIKDGISLSKKLKLDAQKELAEIAVEGAQ